MAGAAAPALLLVLALMQAWRGFEDELASPDKGGGFGMFSTVDRLNWRNFRAYAIAGERVEAIVVGEELFDRVHRGAATPDAETVHGVARAVAERVEPWVERVRVEYWKLVFDRESLVCRRVLLNAGAVEVGGGR